ncbi:uncharacterized protein THITE_2118145 [Thermothielavioides terrestris NRRL 8126]|uniref:Uncharacterized protein n=1 Tax=Thermothielavioides terrestris (strain ATCC 38088 / NRRL 8126) TaxID=578455 RepID=G2R8T5_THETT|nr:uncharacterized protein THITE_2118145 [Thermothielavioides terrestris NRRL 8126]AEO68584.1 hypothetical protein THITE_2118145 [Thermothielavioides terrestris NRRL 8126]
MGAPVILCGRTEAIGSGVIADLKPEFDVIHFIMNQEAGATQIPAILRGEQEVETQSALGSHDYSKKPVAVILGGGYDDAAIEVMMRAAAGIHPIPWLRPDLTIPAPAVSSPGYGKALVERIKVVLAQLEKDGKMHDEKVVLY